MEVCPSHWLVKKSFRSEEDFHVFDLNWVSIARVKAETLSFPVDPTGPPRTRPGSSSHSERLVLEGNATRVDDQKALACMGS